MVCKRVIGVLIYKDGKIYQSIKFKLTNQIGNAITKIEYYNSWSVDEIILLNVEREDNDKKLFYELLEQLSKRTFVPITIGGWIKNVDDAKMYQINGADKISVNSMAVKQPDLIDNLSKKFGSQFIVLSIDAKKIENDFYVVIDRGREVTKILVKDWVVEAEKRGIGEVFLNCIDHDGSRKGYNTELLKLVREKIKVPLIAFGGAWEWSHLHQAIDECGADAVALGNILHFREQSVKMAKNYLFEKKINVRAPSFFKYNKVRTPNYKDVL